MRTLTLALIASGCWASCHPPDACLRFDPKATVAFAGVASHVTILSSDNDRTRARVTFRVVEMLYGLAAGTREVVVIMGQWPSATPKETLLVDAVRRNGEIHTDGCETGIYSMPGPANELEFYRQVRDGAYRPVLKVVVNVPGARVRLTRPGFERDAVVSEWGTAELKDLAPGKYRVTVRHSSYLPPPDQEVTITADHCTQVTVPLVAASSLTGVAFDTRGVAIPGLVVDLVHEGGSGRSVRTDSAGRFRFAALPPGAYVLGTELYLGSDMLPDTTVLAPRCQQPGTIRVRAFQNMTGIELRCKGLGAMRQVRVLVLDGANGRPVAGAEVGSSYPGDDPSQVSIPYGLKTDANGWARITVMDGAWLEIQAIAADGRKSPVAKVAQGTGSRVLTLKL